MTLAQAKDEDATSALVEAFLRARPSWLAEHPDLYRVLTPPARLHGEALADHMVAMVGAERAHAAAMAARADGVLAAGRAAAGLAGRVQDAVLVLIRSHNIPECVAHALPGILAVDAASLCVEDDPSGEPVPAVRGLPAGAVAGLLDGRDVVFRHLPEDAALLHAEAARLARHDALVRVPWPGRPALLALVTRDALALDPAQGRGALAFLGRALGAALGR